MSKNRKANEIYITRIYDAPVQMVWEAWVDPKQVAQWWGPRGFTLTTRSKEVKVGGIWDYTMHGPDGIDYPNLTVFHEVEKHAKLVYDHGASAGKPPMFRVTVLFSETGGKTKMEMTMALPTAEEAAATKKFIKAAGGNSTWDRLAEFLTKGRSKKESFVIARSFDAPIETIFDMFVNPEHFSKWIPPTGSDMKFFRSEIKVGKSVFYSMEGAHGILYGRSHYIEITRPNKLVYTQQFVDKDEKISRHPMAPTWPETNLTTVELLAEDANTTLVKITWEPHGNVTPEELAMFVSAKGGMTGGWTGSFDKLEELLSARA